MGLRGLYYPSWCGSPATEKRKKLERSIAWGSGGFTTLGGAVARLQRKTAKTWRVGRGYFLLRFWGVGTGTRCRRGLAGSYRTFSLYPGLSIKLRHLYRRWTCLYEWRRGRHLYWRRRWWRKLGCQSSKKPLICLFRHSLLKDSFLRWISGAQFRVR